MNANDDILSGTGVDQVIDFEVNDNLPRRRLEKEIYLPGLLRGYQGCPS